MSEHVLISCNQCRRGLRVRVKYLGQSVGCNHCGHLFVAKVRADSKSASVASPTSGRLAKTNSAETTITSAVQHQELEQLREDRLRLKAENDRLSSRLATANHERLSLHLRAEDLDSQLRQALEHVQLIQNELAACEVDRSEINRLRIEAFALREAAMHALRLEDELQTLQQHVEERRVEYDENLARATQERDQAVSDRQKTVSELELAMSRLEEEKYDRHRVAHCGGIRGGADTGRPDGEPLIE